MQNGTCKGKEATEKLKAGRREGAERSIRGERKLKRRFESRRENKSKTKEGRGEHSRKNKTQTNKDWHEGQGGKGRRKRGEKKEVFKLSQSF